MLAKVLRDESPDLVAVAFDPRGGSFRRRIFEGYKANRDAQPEEDAEELGHVGECHRSQPAHDGIPHGHGG